MGQQTAEGNQEGGEEMMHDLLTLILAVSIALIASTSAVEIYLRSKR